MKVKALKTMRYGTEIIEKGEIGELADEENDSSPFTGEPIYDHFVRFGRAAFGVFNDEVEITHENQP